MSVTKVSSKSSSTSPKPKRSVGHLDPYESEEFLARLRSRKTGSFALLGRAAQVSCVTLHHWFNGGRIRRSLAAKIRRNLQMREAAPDALEQVAAELRQETDGRFRRTLFWRAAMIVTQKLNPAGATLVLTPYPLLRLGEIEVLFLQLGAEPCYRISVAGELSFEGTLSLRLVSFLKEFEVWHYKNKAGHAAFRKNLMQQYEQQPKSPRRR